ncbi:hypothetical protein ACA910_020385 [Epithemia clementina (nom. ined.)]
MIQSLARGFLIRRHHHVAKKEASTSATGVTADSPQDTPPHRRSKLGRLVPQSIKHMLHPHQHRSSSSSSLAKTWTRDVSNTETATPDNSLSSMDEEKSEKHLSSPAHGRRQRGLGGLLAKRRANSDGGGRGGGLFRRSHVWLSSSPPSSPDRDKSSSARHDAVKSVSKELPDSPTPSMADHALVAVTTDEDEKKQIFQLAAEQASALHIQRTVRVFLVKRDSGATCIQALVRMHLAQTKTAQLKQQSAASRTILRTLVAYHCRMAWMKEKQRQDSAAHILQRALVRYRVQCSGRRQQEAAARIMQKAWRQRWARLMLPRQRQTAASTIIQAAVSRHCAKKLARRQKAARTLQRALSCYHAKCVWQRHEEHATAMKRLCRQAAARALQRALVAYRAKCQIKLRREEAARLLQCVWRQYRREEAALFVMQQALIRHSRRFVWRRQRQARKQRNEAAGTIQRTWSQYSNTRMTAAMVIQRALLRHHAKCVRQRLLEEAILEQQRVLACQDAAAGLLQRVMTRYCTQCVLRRCQREEDAARQESEQKAAVLVQRALARHYKRQRALREAVQQENSAKVIARSLRLYRYKQQAKRKGGARREQQKAAVMIQLVIARHHKRLCALREAAQKDRASRVIARSLAVFRSQQAANRNAAAYLTQQEAAAGVIQCAWAVYCSKRILLRLREDRLNAASRSISKCIAFYSARCTALKRVALDKHQLVEEEVKRHREQRAARVITRLVRLAKTKAVSARNQAQQAKPKELNAVAQRRNKLNVAANTIRCAWMVYRAKCVLANKRRAAAWKMRRRMSASAAETTASTLSKHDPAVSKTAVWKMQRRMSASAAEATDSHLSKRAPAVGKAAVWKMQRRMSASAAEATNSGLPKQTPIGKPPESNAFTRRRDRMHKAARTLQRAWRVYRAKCVLDNNRRKQMAVSRQRKRRIEAVGIIRRAWLIYRAKRVMEHKRKLRVNAASRVIARALHSFFTKSVVRRAIALRKQQKQQEKASRIIGRGLARYVSKRVAEKKATRKAAIVIQCAWAVYCSKRTLEIMRLNRRNQAARTITRALSTYFFKCVLERMITSRAEMRQKEEHAARVLSRSLAIYRIKRAAEREKIAEGTRKASATTPTPTPEKKSRELTAVALRRKKLNGAANVIRCAWMVYRAKCVLANKRRAAAWRMRRRMSASAAAGMNTTPSKPSPEISKATALKMRRRMSASAVEVVAISPDPKRLFVKRSPKSKVVASSPDSKRLFVKRSPESNAFTRRRDRMHRAAKLLQRTLIAYRAKAVLANNRKKPVVVSCHRKRLIGAAHVVQRAWRMYRAKCVLEHKSRERAAIQQELDRQIKATRLVQNAWAAYRLKCKIEQEREQVKHAVLIIGRALVLHRTKRLQLIERMRAAEVIQRTWSAYHSKCVVEEQQKAERDKASWIIWHALMRHRGKRMLNATIALPMLEAIAEEHDNNATVVTCRAYAHGHFRCDLDDEQEVREEKSRSTAFVEDPMLETKKSGFGFKAGAVVASIVLLGVVAAVLSFDKLPVQQKDLSHDATWAGMHHREKTVFGHGKHRHAALHHFEHRYIEGHHHEPGTSLSPHSPLSTSPKVNSDSAAVEKVNSEKTNVDCVPREPLVSIFDSSPSFTRKSPLPTSVQVDLASDRSKEPSISYFDPAPFFKPIFTADDTTAPAKNEGHDATWAGMHHHEHTVFGHGKHRHAAVKHFEHRHAKDHYSHEATVSESEKNSAVEQHQPSLAIESQKNGAELDTASEDNNVADSILWSDMTEWKWLATRIMQRNKKPQKTNNFDE